MTVLEAPVDLRPLRRRFRGAILAPGDSRWDAARQEYNLTVDQAPALVSFAREQGLQVAPQRTGHNAGPLGSLDDVILVKADAMRGVQIDPQRHEAYRRLRAVRAEVDPGNLFRASRPIPPVA